MSEKQNLQLSEVVTRPEVFCKKGVLKNFAKFTGKHLHQNLFFSKVADLRSATLLKKRVCEVFPCEFYEIFKNIFFYRTLPLTISELRQIIFEKKRCWLEKKISNWVESVCHVFSVSCHEFISTNLFAVSTSGLFFQYILVFLKELWRSFFSRYVWDQVGFNPLMPGGNK